MEAMPTVSCLPMLPIQSVELCPASPGMPTTGSDQRDAVWLGLARALLLPASTEQDLRQALQPQVTDDVTRWWTASPFEGRKGQRGTLDILTTQGTALLHDATSLLAVATMSPHPWAWPCLVEHWDAVYATDGRRSPHPTWLRAEVRRSLIHLVSPATMAWWLDSKNLDEGLSNDDATRDRQALVAAWWRGLAHFLLSGKAENVVLSGNLPPQDVWAVFDTLRAHGLATLEDWSRPRNLAGSRRGSHPNAHADRALPLGMAPIEAVLSLRGSEPIVTAWLAEGGDPNLTNPFSQVSLVQRALQCTTPTNLQALLDAGASLDVAAGAWERSNAYGRPAGVLGYPWCLMGSRFPTQVTEVHLPPGPIDADVCDGFDRLPTIVGEQEATLLGLEPVLRWLTHHQTALRLANEVSVGGVWASGAWQAWLEQRELRKAGPTIAESSDASDPSVAVLAGARPHRRL